MLVLRREQGRLGELEADFRTRAQQYPRARVFQGARALIACELGRAAEARRAFDELAAHDFADILRTYVWLTTMAFLAEVCAALDDADRAAVLYELLSPYAAQNIQGGSAGPCWGSTARYLGLLATTLRRWQEAARHFEAALHAHARLEAWPWHARAQRDYAAMLLARGRAGDREQAVGLLTDALAAAQRIGMPRLTEQALELLERFDRPRHAAPAHASPSRSESGPPGAAPLPDNLSEREGEVLRLLAAGQSNKEIAAALSLSVRTVEHHVANIYVKIDVHGRVEATAYALRRGLLPARPGR
jgi:DNA-binding CsgD family transcriptional regulator